MRTTLLLLSILCLIATAASVGAIGGGDITFTPAGVDPVKFSHDHHTKARGLKCSVCHNGMKSFDAASAKNCARCHSK